MSERDRKLPLSVDIGVKANLEIKAEVPKQSAGRLVDALTDIFRPFTEARGLKADQIRLQREDVLFEIAKKARARAVLEEVELHPVPTKLLVPFIEKASLEDLDKDMQDRWAALLLSASKEYHARHLTFVDILTRLSSDELRLLEEICFSFKGFPETYYPGGHMDENRIKLEGSSPLLMISEESTHEEIRAANNRFIEASPLTYGRIMHASVRSKGTVFYYTKYGGTGTPHFRSLEILQRERLVDIEQVRPRGTGVHIGYFNITFLGISFVLDCSPDAPKMAARRPKPIPVPRGGGGPSIR